MTFHRSPEDPDAVIFDLPDCDRAKAVILEAALGEFLVYVAGKRGETRLIGTRLNEVEGGFTLTVDLLNPELDQVAQDFIHGFLADED